MAEIIATTASALIKSATTIATSMGVINNVVIQTATAINEVTAIIVRTVTTVKMVVLTTKIKETVPTMDSTGIGEEIKVLMVALLTAVLGTEITVTKEVRETRL